MAEQPDVQLLVAGPGDPEAVLADVATALHDRIHFLGLLSDADKARFFASVDVYVAPNTGGESFGIVLLEAMAAGTAVVCSDLDAFRRVVEDTGADDGESAGLLFGVRDAAALSTALAALLADPALRAALVARGRAVARRYDWDVVTDQIVAVYETVAVGGGVVTEDHHVAAAEQPGWWRLRERLAEWWSERPGGPDDDAPEPVRPDESGVTR